MQFSKKMSKDNGKLHISVRMFFQTNFKILLYKTYFVFTDLKTNFPSNLKQMNVITLAHNLSFKYRAKNYIRCLSKMKFNQLLASLYF